MAIDDRLSGAARIGLGLAAVGRPGYINLGRAVDLPAERTVEALRDRAHELLDRAYAAGVRYFDVARSYGRAEEFLALWLRARPAATDVVVGSKWGYTYTAGWRVEAEAHEVKDHSVATFDRQLRETRDLLGDRLDLYQVHSVTPDSPALHDVQLHRRLAELAGQGTLVGLSTSGPAQAEAIRAAIGVRFDGEPVFRSVQATWNLLEPSAGPALAEAHDAGLLVIVKEALANGRLAEPRSADDATALARPQSADDAIALARPRSADDPTALARPRSADDPTALAAPARVGDAAALAAALHQPWADIVLSGAATADQLASNLRAETMSVDPAEWSDLAEPAARYWRTRANLPWS